MQGSFERLEHVVGCFHVSGLKMRRLTWPLAGMAMRGAEAHQTLGISGPLNHPAFSAPDLADPLPLQFVELLTPPRVRLGLRSGCYRGRILEVLVCGHHGPEATRHLVGECDGHQHAQLLGQRSA